MNRTLRNFSAIDINGEIVSLQKYQGNIVLIVNTATKCVLSNQLTELKKLYDKYKDKNFVILGFPCNQFGNSEPDDEFTIRENCLQKFQIDFPMFDRIDVNGKEEHVLFKWLKNELGSFPTNHIKWNFTKFLINQDGKPIKRFGPFTKPHTIERYITLLLQEKKDDKHSSSSSSFQII